VVRKGSKGSGADVEAVAYGPGAKASGLGDVVEEDVGFGGGVFDWDAD
jgi:hypothetical protein